MPLLVGTHLWIFAEKRPAACLFLFKQGRRRILLVNENSGDLRGEFIKGSKEVP